MNPAFVFNTSINVDVGLLARMRSGCSWLSIVSSARALVLVVLNRLVLAPKG